MIKITDKEFLKISQYIKANYGINLREEKTTLLMGRLHQELVKLGLDNYTDYYNYLIADRTGRASSTLIEKMSTNHTFFMRERDHFNYFKETVLPFLERTVRDRDLRIWSAASSSGEEPYTLAMIIDQYFSGKTGIWNKDILATDISERILDTAKKGIYTKERTAPLPLMWKNKYLKPHGEDVVIAENIKNKVIFGKYNLMDERIPFKKKFHVIFCRNVMIYFDAKTRNELANRFYERMEVGGYLFVGHSESLDRNHVRFEYVMPSVYRKI